MKHYIDIQVIDEDSQFMLTKLFSIVHAFISQEKKNTTLPLSISFPYWEFDETQKITQTGNILRLFGSEEILSKLSSFEGIQLYLKRRAIKLFNVKLTPQTNNFVRFSRLRTQEKNQEGFQIRQFNRTNRKLTKKGLNPKEFKSENFKKSNKARIENTYFFKLISKSTNDRTFSLFVIKENAQKLSSNFNSYGLSSEVDAGVPDF